jgi:hypothetical protein
MAAKKTGNLSAGLIATKGAATPAADVVGRQTEAAPPTASVASAPLNFKVDEDFRRRFRLRAAEHDLKLNELLRECFAAWEREKRAS